MSNVVAVRAACLAVSLTAWAAVGAFWPRSQFYISSPQDVFANLFAMVHHEGYIVDFGITGLETCLGLAFGLAVGLPVGFALWNWASLGRALEPVLVAFAAIPVLSVAPLAIIWLGVGPGMKIGLAAIGVFFIAVQSTYRGAKTSFEQFARNLPAIHTRRVLLVRKIVLPGAFAWILGGMRTSVGVAMLGAFIGEFIASERGLGHLIIRSTSLYNVSRSLAAAAGIALLAVLLDHLAYRVERRRRWLAQLISVPKAVRVTRVAPLFDRRTI